MNMRNNTNLSINKIVLIYNTLAFGVMIFVANSSAVQVVSFICMYLLTVIIEKFELSSPLCWYLGAFTVYSVGYPILYLLGIDTSRGLSITPLKWCWIGYFIFVLTFGKFKKQCDNVNELVSWKNKRYFYFFIIFAGLYVLVCVFFIWRLGYQNKGEIYSDNKFYIKLAFIIIYTIQTIYVYLISINYETKKYKYNKAIIIFVGVVSALLAMYSGERDILLRFVLMTIFALYSNKIIDTRKVALMLLIAISLYPLTSNFKYFFLTNQFKTIQISDEPILHYVAKRILSGEFESASRNLQILANDKENVLGTFGGITYFSDITRIIGYAPASSLMWFNNRYYAGSTVGHGFTIVGEGLVNFGVMGIVLSFAFIGFLQTYIYNYRDVNAYYKTIYIVSIPIFMYSTRADFANILSPMVRQIILPLFLMDIFTKRKTHINLHIRRKK